MPTAQKPSTHQPSVTQEPSHSSTPNPLAKREPELVKNFAAFQSHIGDTLLVAVGKLLADRRFRAHHAPDVLEDLHAAGKVLSVLVKDKWTEQDLDTFDTYWRDAMRSDLFGDEFEAERHRIQASVEAARTKLLEAEEPEVTTGSPKVKQRTLW
jgi:hypothetical protein